jgi:alpha-tubulin suppressor-like RCC1 family protein
MRFTMVAAGVLLLADCDSVLGIQQRPLATDTASDEDSGGADVGWTGMANDGAARDASTGDGSASEASMSDGADGPLGDAAVGDPVVQIAGGDSTICALTHGGSVYCWGKGDYGTFAGPSVTGTTPSACSPGGSPHLCQSVPTKVAGLDHIVQLGADGTSEQCALRADGVVLCWGSNSANQLGHAQGTTGDVACPTGGGWCNTTPQAIDFPAGVTVAQLEAGDGWACVLSGAGDVWCWGRNDYGNLGQGAANVPANSYTPLKVNGLANVRALSVGNKSSACALRADGVALCWGYNAYGSLGHQPGTHGDDANDNNGTATEMLGSDNTTLISGLTAISAHCGATCALRGGTVSCNASWTLFGSSPGGASFALQQVPGFSSGVASFDAADQLCTAGSNGQLRCGGGDGTGELGDGNYAASYEPAAVHPEVPPATHLHTDAYIGKYTFVVTHDGSVWAAGSNYYGELGHTPGTENDVPAPYYSNTWARSNFAIVPNLP